jgi:hypothetical protein
VLAESPLTQQRLAGAYIHYLLEYRVIELLKRRPSPEDLQSLAAQKAEMYSQLLPANPVPLVDTMLTTFKLATPDREVKGGRFAVTSTAALGILLDRPLEQLATRKRGLARPRDQSRPGTCSPRGLAVRSMTMWAVSVTMVMRGRRHGKGPGPLGATRAGLPLAEEVPLSALGPKGPRSGPAPTTRPV